MSEELNVRVCPWCHSVPLIERWHGGGPEKRLIGCDDEECLVSPGVTGETKEEAIQIWNSWSAPESRRLSIESEISLTGDDRRELDALLSDLEALAKRHQFTITGKLEKSLPSFMLWEGKIAASHNGPRASLEIRGGLG